MTSEQVPVRQTVKVSDETIKTTRTYIEWMLGRSGYTASTPVEDVVAQAIDEVFSETEKSDRQITPETFRNFTLRRARRIAKKHAQLALPIYPVEIEQLYEKLSNNKDAVDSALLLDEFNKQLWGAIDRLPKDWKTVLLAYHYYEKSPTLVEIAEKMKCNEKTIRRWLEKAYEQVKNDEEFSRYRSTYLEEK
jgi:RNA polymerase sigma factor (sigma-70 family)